MNKFNLTFSGEILPGLDPEQVKLRFAAMFNIDDRERLNRFFSGETITLRRNLERKAAAQSFQDLQRVGVLVALVKVAASEESVPAPDLPAGGAPPPDPEFSDTPPPEQQGQPDRFWAVSPTKKPSGPAKEKTGRKPDRQSLAAKKQARAKAATLALRKSLEEEEAASQSTIAAETQRKAEQEARRQAELAEKKRLEEEEAARKAAIAAKAKRKAEEEAARRKVELAEKKRLEEEEAARKAAIAAEAKRKAEEEAARRKAELAEKKRLEEEEAARKAAIAAEAKRKAEEEAARRKAELAEKKRLEEEEAARKAAIAAEAKRKAEEEAARRKAELAERKRIAAEEAARKKALKEEEKRKAAEEIARRKAEREKEKAERARLKAEEAARQKAILEEKRRRAEEAARREAKLAERKRRDAEEAARLQAELDDITRQEQEQSARLQAELAQKERQAAAEARRIKAEAQQKAAEAKQKSAERLRAAETNTAAATMLLKKPGETSTAGVEQPRSNSARAQQESEPLDERRAMEDKAEQRAAGELALQTPLRAIKGRIKTNLDVPARQSNRAAKPESTPSRRRQPGEPNLYQLRPFRNAPEIAGRAERSRTLMRRGLLVGGIALACLLIGAASLLRQTPAALISGASAIGIDSQSGPVLLAGKWLLFHDRAGMETKSLNIEALGLASLQGPMIFDAEGHMLVLGRLRASNPKEVTDEGSQLIRCSLPQPDCQRISEKLNNNISSFVLNPIDSTLLLADKSNSELLKINSEGVILARAPITLPEKAVLRLHTGLLFMNSAQGPAISVFRYDEKAFGQQLDEVLLMPPNAVKEEQSTTGDFVWSGGAWWVSLLNTQTGNLGLYRFDADWKYLNQPDIQNRSNRQQLVNWGDKTLVNDHTEKSILRFNAQGLSEAPLQSKLLTELVTQQRQQSRALGLIWQGGLILCALIAIAGLGFGYLQNLRTVVYKSHREHGAEPIDDHSDALQWIDPVEDRKKQLQRRGISYGLFTLALVIIAVGQSVSVLQLSAVLIALSGPAIFLLFFSRRPCGHIGVLQDRLLLVDHEGMYHCGGGSRVQYRGAFLLIDDVIVFSGNRLLPAFSPQQVQAVVRPVATGGIKVDRGTIVTKMLQARHPLAHGTLAIIATATVATVLLCLQGIF